MGLSANDLLSPGTWDAPRVDPADRMFTLIRPYTATRDRFRLLAAATVVLLALAIATFGDAFPFWSLPLSDLGLPRTQSGKTNYASFVIFAVNMLAGCLIMVGVARSFARTVGIPGRSTKTALAVLSAVGFLVGIFPHDRFPGFHTAGCGAMIGGLWCLGVMFSRELWRLRRTKTAVELQFLLQLTILPYAATYALQADSKQALQKIAILGLLVALTRATHHLRRAVVEAAIEQARAQRGRPLVSMTGGGYAPRQQESPDATTANRHSRSWEHGSRTRAQLHREPAYRTRGRV